MNLSAILTALRYILSFGGGFLVAKGHIDQETLNQVIGALLTLATAGAGIYVNVKNNSKAKAAEIVLTTATPGMTDQQIATAAATLQK